VSERHPLSLNILYNICLIAEQKKGSNLILLVCVQSCVR